MEAELLHDRNQSFYTGIVDLLQLLPDLDGALGISTALVNAFTDQVKDLGGGFFGDLSLLFHLLDLLYGGLTRGWEPQVEVSVRWEGQNWARDH